MHWLDIVSLLLVIMQVFLLGALAGFKWGHKTGWNACDSFHKRWSDKK